MTPLTAALRKTADHLLPHREALVDGWMRELSLSADEVAADLRAYCREGIDSLLARLSRGELEQLLHEEEAAAGAALRAGADFRRRALALRALERSCVPVLLASCGGREDLAECLLALDELEGRRLSLLLQAQEHELSRRLASVQDEAARAAERAQELERTVEALRRSEARSQHRAEQIALLGAVAHRLAPVLDPERLLQEAAEVIQGRLDYNYVALVVLDDEGVLVGRWAGRPGVGRRSAGRTQGPAGGVIGRALRKKAPQVAPDVARDPDYHADVPGTRSEMVIPLLDGGEPVGAVDFQSTEESAFDLDDVAVGETLAEFLVVALRNARLVAELRRTRE